MIFVSELVNTPLAEHYPKWLISSQAMVALEKKKKKKDTLIMFAQQSVSGIYIIQDIFVAGIY